MQGEVLFNGLSVQRVEQRMTACPDKTQWPDEWRYMCAKGFLAPGERLLQVIARDEARLTALGTTRREVADRLAAVLRALEAAKCDSVDGEEFCGRKKWFIGKQYSPFYNDNEPHSPHNHTWCEEWKVWHTRHPKVVLVIAGNSDAGSVSLVRDFGFFEGGLQGTNRYRLDPDVLWCVLNGAQQLSPEAQHFVELRVAHRRQRRQRAREQLLQDMTPQLQGPHAVEARAFLEAHLRKLADE